MFNPNGYENSRPDGIAVLEVPARPDRDLPRQFVPLKRTEVGGEILGPLAALSVVHTFLYRKEQCSQVLEAIYRFPLPGDAAVTGVTVCFGEVEIRAALKERQQAEVEYAQARAEGRQGALVTREAPDVFSLQVTGLQPDQEITVETQYVQLAHPEGVGWTLRLPLATAPRYVRSDERTAAQAQGQPLLLLRDPGHRFSLDLLLPGASVVESSTHALEVGVEDGRTRVRLQGHEVIPDRDCVLSWRLAQAEDRPSLQVLTHDDPAAGHTYFLALLTPPAAPDPQTAVPREVVLLVDHSGSMGGAKWSAADWAAKKFLANLTPRDVFGLAVFHDTTRWFTTTLQPGSARAVESARQFLEACTDSGGTELGVALEQALSLERDDEERARHVLVVTDAQVTDMGRVLRLAEEESRLSNRRRLSILCIDAAPNSFLALEIARRGGGMARFLTSNPAEGDITTALDEVLADWSQPVRAGLRLEVNRPAVEASGRQASARAGEWSGIDLGDLPASRTVWAIGRVARDADAALEFRVVTGTGEAVAAAGAQPIAGPFHGRALKALFGAWRVLGLEFLLSSGYSGQELAEELRQIGYEARQELSARATGRPKVYAENVRAEVEKRLGGLLLRESLAYGLLSSATGFVAVRTEAGKLIEGTVPVAGALPAGWSEEFAAGAPMVAATTYRTMAAMSPVRGMPPQARSRSKLPGAMQALSFLRRNADRASTGAPAPEAQAPAPPLADTEPRLAADRTVSAQMSAAPSRPPRERKRSDKEGVRFSGVLLFEKGEAVLFDSARPDDAARLPDEVTFSSLRLRFLDPAPPEDVLADLLLLVFVDDLTLPRASVKLSDLLKQGGQRPLNVLKLPGQPVRLELRDPKGRWATGAPRMEVVLE